MVNWKALEEEVSGEASFRVPLALGATLSSSSTSTSSSSDSEENVEKPEISTPHIIRVRGKGKKTTIMREPRDAPTDSKEEVPAKPKAPKKFRQKPTAIAREGHPFDKFFHTISLIVPRVRFLGNQEWADEFAQILVHFERRDGVPRVVAPDISDRAHDSYKGMVVYWKMPKCGFWLPLSKFSMDLLRTWDITPSQLTSTLWCVIISFEIMFHEFQKIMSTDQPTLPVFDHYFHLMIANHDYLVVKRRQGGLEIFDSSNPQISRIDAWNE
jgi:Putative gypsy type transposon